MDELDSVSAAVAEHLAALPVAAQRSVQARQMVRLAEILDSTRSARDIASVSKELRETLAELTERYPVAPAEKSRLMLLQEERERRRAG